MDTLTAMAIAGIFIEVVGFALAAFGVRSKWREHARGWDRFFPQRVRNLVGRRRPVQVEARDAAMTADAAAKAVAVRKFRESDPVEDRLRALEEAVTDAARNLQHHIHSTGDALREVNTRVTAQRQEIMSTLEQAQSQGRVEIVTDLRLAGWGLILAVLGLALQVPSTITG
ncbi:hypothetical protein [Rhodococcus sp. B50]|uniref:hypothetical protein n=1 Tax=Rhodococcus sp. B50 TaxID=2682847 RepID=UPI001A05F577|nr:hypothetical protein [Rhodococcus sp. B50]